MSYGCQKGIFSVLHVLLALGRRVKAHHSLILLIANENERLALSSSSHPCSSVLSGFLKESVALPNTSHSSAIPAAFCLPPVPPHLTRVVKQEQPWVLTPGSSSTWLFCFPLPHSARPAAFPARRDPAFSWAGIDSFPLILSNTVSYHWCF